jgi:hypothetical protein
MVSPVKVMPTDLNITYEWISYHLSAWILYHLSFDSGISYPLSVDFLPPKCGIHYKEKKEKKEI